MSAPYKVLVTGGRHFDNPSMVYAALDVLLGLHDGLVVIHGGATGTDGLAQKWVTSRDPACRRVNTIRMNAQWAEHGRAAGPLRNQEMVNLKPDLVLAFMGYNGTRDCVRRAKEAGIKVVAVGAWL